MAPWRFICAIDELISRSELGERCILKWGNAPENENIEQYRVDLRVYNNVMNTLIGSSPISKYIVLQAQNDLQGLQQHK